MPSRDPDFGNKRQRPFGNKGELAVEKLGGNSRNGVKNIGKQDIPTR
ncbi:hypothetical protein ACQVU2_20050 [Bacillus mycoides]